MEKETNALELARKIDSEIVVISPPFVVNQTGGRLVFTEFPASPTYRAFLFFFFSTLRPHADNSVAPGGR